MICRLDIRYMYISHGQKRLNRFPLVTYRIYICTSIHTWVSTQMPFAINIAVAWYKIDKQGGTKQVGAFIPQTHLKCLLCFPLAISLSSSLSFWDDGWVYFILVFLLLFYIYVVQCVINSILLFDKLNKAIKVLQCIFVIMKLVFMRFLFLQLKKRKYYDSILCLWQKYPF